MHKNKTLTKKQFQECKCPKKNLNSKNCKLIKVKNMMFISKFHYESVLATDHQY